MRKIQRPFTKRDKALQDTLFLGTPLPAAKKPRAKPKTEEKDAQNAIIAHLKQRPDIAWYARINSGSFQIENRRFIANSKKGMSDIIGQMNGSGQFLAIEVKSSVGKIKPHQQDFLNEVNNGGGIGFVARSTADVKKVLDNII